MRRSLATAVAASMMALSSVPVEAQDPSATLRDLHASDFRLRVNAVLVLGRAHVDGARRELEAALSDDHPAVRGAAVVALGVLGDTAALSALEARMRTESLPDVKAQLVSVIENLRAASGMSWAKTRYVLQLGSMRNESGVSSDTIGGALRRAAKMHAAVVPGAYVVDADRDTGTLQKQAAQRQIPMLGIDGVVTGVSQTRANGTVAVKARVEFSVRRVSDQTLRGTLSGVATSVGSSSGPLKPEALNRLQEQAVEGAVASALRGMDAAGLSRFAK